VLHFCLPHSTKVAAALQEADKALKLSSSLLHRSCACNCGLHCAEDEVACPCQSRSASKLAPGVAAVGRGGGHDVGAAAAVLIREGGGGLLPMRPCRCARLLGPAAAAPCAPAPEHSLERPHL
jgi:hypothetical protein